VPTSETIAVTSASRSEMPTPCPNSVATSALRRSTIRYTINAITTNRLKNLV
jgi:hypothetical protein